MSWLTILAICLGLLVLILAVLLVVSVGILGFLLAVSIAFNLRLARIIFSTEDAIEKSLDILDNLYGEMTKIAEKEIFFDSPEVRHAVSTIHSARGAVLYVANALASIDMSAIQELEDEED